MATTNMPHAVFAHGGSSIPDDMLLELVKMHPREVFKQTVETSYEYTVTGSKGVFKFPVISVVSASTKPKRLERLQSAYSTEPDVWQSADRDSMRRSIIQALDYVIRCAHVKLISLSSADKFNTAMLEFLEENSRFALSVEHEIDFSFGSKNSPDVEKAVAEPSVTPSARLSDAELVRLFGA